MIRKSSPRTALLLVAGALLWTEPVLAQQVGVPGVGVVVKKKPGNAPILVPADANGEVRLTGLEPGDYEIAPVLANRASNLKDNIITSVGQDGRLALAVEESDVRPAPAGRRMSERLRHKARAILFDRAPANAVTFDMRQAFSVSPPVPCDRPQPGMPNTCPGRIRNYIDANASSAAEIVRLAPETSPAASTALIAERTRGGPFTSAQDFAHRVCTRTAIDFGDVPVRMGNTSLLVMRGSDPKNPGFKCASGKVTVYGEAVDTINLNETIPDR